MSSDVFHPQYECFAVKLFTNQGYPLAAGGICTAGFAVAWRNRLQALRSLSICDHSLVGIDRTLAEALQELSDDTLLLVGASVDTGDAFGETGRTGGVLGSPVEEIRSATGNCDALENGFHLWAEPGGPGLAADGEEAVIRRVLMQIQSLKSKLRSTQHMEQILHAYGLRTGLLVFDGTGKHAQGLVMAFADRKLECHFLEGMPGLCPTIWHRE